MRINNLQRDDIRAFAAVYFCDFLYPPNLEILIIEFDRLPSVLGRENFLIPVDSLTCNGVVDFRVFVNFVIYFHNINSTGFYKKTQ